MNPDHQRHIRRAVAVLSVVAVAGLTLAGPPVVKNERPQPPTNPVDVDWPIYYPLDGKTPPSDDAGITAEGLLYQLREFHTAMRYQEALLVADQLVAVAPDHPIGHYNRACVLARLRRNDEALQALDKAVDGGWRNTMHSRFDFDLDALRHEPRFDKVMKRMEELRVAEAIKPAPRRVEPWQEIVEELGREVPGLLRRYQVPGATVALLRDRDVVWTGGFGVSRVGADSALSDEAAFDLRAPLDLLAVVAMLQQQEPDEDFNVASLFAYSLETMPRRAEPPRRSPAFLVGSRRPGRGMREADPSPSTPDPKNIAGAEHTFDLLTMAVEIESEQRFDSYCREHILTPAGATGVEFVASGEMSRPVTGHTGLGTPIDVVLADGEVRTSAADLARIVASLDGKQPLAAVADELKQVASVSDRLGLRVSSRTTPDGVRLEIAGRHAGQGCLVRWYPEHGSGVVVLFNSDAGADAAERIAQLAVGGR